MTSELKIVQEYSTLEKACLDFQVLRVQFFLGFLCSALSLALLFCHSAGINSVPNISESISERLGSAPPQNLRGTVYLASPVPGASPIDEILHNLDNLLSSRIHIKLVGFLTYLSSTLFLGLIVLELTGKTGNRLGAVPAIWAMFLFTVVPNGVLFLENAPLSADLLNCVLLLIAIFAVLRFQLTRQKMLLAVAGLGLLAASIELFFQSSYLWREGVRPNSEASEIIRLCSNYYGDLLGVEDSRHYSLLLLPLSVVGTLGLTRYFAKTLPFRIMLSGMVCLVSMGLGLTFASGAFNSLSLTLEAEPLSFFGRAALCAFMPVVSLQASGGAPRKQAFICNLMALASLTWIFCGWLSQALLPAKSF